MANVLKSSDKEGKQHLSERDAFDTLSLSMIPLSSQSLKAARLVKNSELETMVELHNDPVSGSLQIRPQDVAATFPGSDDDQAIIGKLANLKSYDVYSLRNSLTQLGIDVDVAALELSEGMKEKLDQYSVEFTRPLVRNIFGGGNDDINSKEGLLRIFRDPDVARVRSRLNLMAEKTGIPVGEIPGFLRNYSDLFISVAYYRYTLESLAPDIGRFLSWLTQLKTQREVIASPLAMSSCEKAEETAKFLSTSVGDRLALMNAGFELFWSDMNRKSFEQLRRKIEDNHVGMGAALCGLLVKMRAWSNAFSDNSSGVSVARIKYVMVMLPGLERLRVMENDARLMAANF
jgi:hypothetical protein